MKPFTTMSLTGPRPQMELEILEAVRAARDLLWQAREAERLAQSRCDADFRALDEAYNLLTQVSRDLIGRSRQIAAHGFDEYDSEESARATAAGLPDPAEPAPLGGGVSCAPGFWTLLARLAVDSVDQARRHIAACDQVQP